MIYLFSFATSNQENTILPNFPNDSEMIGQVCDAKFRHVWLLNKTSYLEFYTPKQQSVGGHVIPLGHIILILSQPIFAISP